MDLVRSTFGGCLFPSGLYAQVFLRFSYRNISGAIGLRREFSTRVCKKSELRRSEGGVENLFSRAGLLSDPNMDPHYLGMLTSIVAGKATYNPPYEKIKAKYFEKCIRGKGGDGDDEGATVNTSEAGPSSAAGPSQARASPSSDAGLLPFGLLRSTSPRPAPALLKRIPSPTRSSMA